MNQLEKTKIRLETIEEDPTLKQLVGILWDIINLIEDKKEMGFKTDDKKEK